MRFMSGYFPVVLRIERSYRQGLLINERAVFRHLVMGLRIGLGAAFLCHSRHRRRYMRGFA